MRPNDQKQENARRFYSTIEALWREYLTHIEQSKERLKEFVQKFRASIKDTLPVNQDHSKSVAEQPVESNEKRKVFTLIEQFLARFSVVIAEAKANAQQKLNAKLANKNIPKDSPTAKHGKAIIDHTFSMTGITNDAFHLQARGKTKLVPKGQHHEAMRPHIKELHDQYQKSNTTYDLFMLVFALRYAEKMYQLQNENTNQFKPTFHIELINEYKPEFNNIAKNGHSFLNDFVKDLISSQYNSARWFQLAEGQQVSAQHTPTQLKK